MKVSVIFICLLLWVPVRCFAAGTKAADQPVQDENQLPVDELTPEQEAEFVNQRIERMQRSDRYSKKEINEFRNILDSLPVEERSKAIELMAELQDLRKEFKPFMSPEEMNELRSKMKNYNHQLWSINPAFGNRLGKNMHDPGERRDFFEAGSKAYPQNGNIKQNYADSLLKTGDNQQAAQVAREAIDLNPKNAQAYSTLADAQLKLGDTESALETARAGFAVTRSPTLLSQVKLLETKAGAAGAANAPPGLPPPSNTPQSRPYDPDAAALRPAPFTMTELKTPAPGMIPVEQGERSRRYAADASQRLKGGNVEEAVKLATKAIDENPSNANALTLRAAAHIRAGHWTEARKDIAAAHKLAPANANVLALYSKVLTHDKEYDAALQMAEAAIHHEPRMADAHYYKALALTGLRRYGDAKESLHEAALLAPEQYQKTYEWALQLPSEDGLAALLGETPIQTASAPSPSKRSNARFLGVGIASLVGGFLVALGLLQTLSGGWASRVKTRITGRRTLKAPAIPVEALPGTTLAGVYQIRKKIGIGGMGVVYEASDLSLERRVAVKKMREELRSDPREAARFLQEARMVAQLHHPNIVDIYAVVEDHGDIYLVFEFVDGITVHHIIDQRKRMAFPDILTILRGTCSALDYAHGRNIIHRDLKPANIMLTRERVVKVMDFGVARQAKDSLARLSMTNTVVGTPPYMAPEQEQGAVCRETDVFALGVMVYEMATGDVPFNGGGAGMLLCKMNKTYAPASRTAPGLPPGFDEFMARALEPDPAKRLHSPGEFLLGLEALSSRSPAT